MATSKPSKDRKSSKHAKPSKDSKSSKSVKKTSSNYRETYFEKNKSNHGWYTCAKCKKKFRKADMDVDHILPQSKGGRHNELNLQCLCVHCNRSKQASTRDTIPDLMRSAGRIVSRESKKTSVGKLLFKK